MKLNSHFLFFLFLLRLYNFSTTSPSTEGLITRYNFFFFSDFYVFQKKPISRLSQMIAENWFQNFNCCLLKIVWSANKCELTLISSRFFFPLTFFNTFTIECFRLDYNDGDFVHFFFPPCVFLFSAVMKQKTVHKTGLRHNTEALVQR